MEEVRRNNNCLLRMRALLEQEMGWTDEDEQKLEQSVADQLARAVEYGMKGTPMAVEDMETNVFVD